MNSNNNIFGWTATHDHEWIVDHYRMARLQLRDYVIMDQFSEPGFRQSKSHIYYWQHRDQDRCTVKVQATVTNSSESAHDMMRRFVSGFANPEVLSKQDNSAQEERWFREMETEEVRFIRLGSEEHMVVLIWGNVFFQIESIGEQNHSIAGFLDDLKDNWAGMTETSIDPEKFNLTANKTTVKAGETVILSKTAPANEGVYNMSLYMAGPRDMVHIYRDKHVIKLDILKPKGIKAKLFEPFALVISVLPDGTYYKSERLRFKVEN